MGNLCSKSANKPDNFAGEGRTLGGSSSANQAEPAPVSKKITSSTPGRTLGGEGRTSPDNARGAAAAAAEARAASANKPTSQLGRNLADQKKRTQAQTLAAGSEQERRARDADQTAQAQQYN